MILFLLLSNLYAAEYGIARVVGQVISFDESKICLKNRETSFCVKRTKKFEYLVSSRGPVEVVYDKSELFEGK